MNPTPSESAGVAAPRMVSTHPEFLPLSTLRAAWKQKVTFLACSSLLAALGAGAFQLLPQSYRAEILILVEAQQIPERLVDSTVNADLTDRVATLQQQMLSTTRLQNIIDRYTLYDSVKGKPAVEDVIRAMRRDITIKIEKGWSRNRPGAIRVTYTGREPAIVSAVANDLGNFFIEENDRSREQRAEGTSEFLTAQLTQARTQLEEYEAKLMAYKKTHAGELPDQTQSIIASISRLQIDLQARQESLMRAQQNRAAIEATLQSAENTLAELLKTAQTATVGRPADTGTATAPAATEPLTRKRSEILEEQLTAGRQRYSDKHPMIRALQAEIATARQREASERPARSAGISPVAVMPSPTPVRRLDLRDTAEIGQARERVSGLKAQLELMGREVDQRQKSSDQVSRELAGLQSNLSRVPVHEQQLLALMRGYEAASNHYKGLTDKNFSADLTADMERRHQAERFSVLEPARPPEKPYSPDPRKGGIAIGMGSLGLGAAFAFLRELRRNVILGEWELPADIPVLGRVPDLS